MWSGVQPSSSLWWTSAPYFTNSFTTSRFPVSTASCSAAIPAHTRLHQSTWSTAVHSHAVKPSQWLTSDLSSFFGIFSHFKSHFKVKERVAAVETLLTWVEECIHTNLPRSHEPPNLLHISTSNNILEDDVIGEVHSSLCRCDRYHRCRNFLCLCATCWAVPWPFAIWRDVRWCRLVSGCVMWWGVMCCAIVCWGVLCAGGICGCVVSWCVMCGGVIGRCVVCWCVLGAACVRWHWYVVVVLHPCSGYGCLPPMRSAQEEGNEKSNGSNQSNNNKKSSILCFVSLLSSPRLPFYPFSFQLIYSLLSLIQVLFKSFSSLRYVPVPFF